MIGSQKKKLIICGVLIVIGACLYRVYTLWLRPTSILVVNALPAQAADIVLNNDCNKIKITCKSMEEAGDFDKYDAVLMYGRGLYLDSIQLCSLGQAASKGIPLPIRFVISVLWPHTILIQSRMIDFRNIFPISVASTTVIW